MSGAILDSRQGVTILGAGEVRAEVLQEALALAPVLVAADSGADRALALGLAPAAVIGDLDSLSEAGRAAIPAERLHLIAEQETTDFDKCLRSVRAPLVLAVGFTGARLDHELAAFASLVRHGPAGAGRGPVLMLGTEDVAFLCPPRLRLAVPPGTRLSLFPFGPVSGQGRGLRWPIDGLTFAPWDRIGTSNETVAPEVELAFAAPRMLAILPRACLSAAISALSPPRRSPPGGR